jgi:glycosyltransferase involved in cell wall biosynthesis
MTAGAAKPRILVLTSTFPRWPDDTEPAFVYQLCGRLRDKYDVTVLAPHAPGAKRYEQMDGIAVYRFRYAPSALEYLAYEGGIPAKLKQSAALWILVPVFLIAQLWATRCLIRSIRPDVVHAHWLIPQGLIAVLAKKLGRHKPRILVTAHGADLFAFEGWLGRLLKRKALKGADHVTVVSKEMASRVRAMEIPANAITIAPMGTDLLDAFVPSNSMTQTPTLVFAGRLAEKKGVADLLTAMPQVLLRIPETRLLIAGDGPLRQQLVTIAKQLNIIASVDFLGRQTPADMPAIYRRARLAVLPFRIASDGDQEGLGLVAVEAMGCGLPVIVGDVPAIHDVVTHSDTGWIVPPGAPDVLADAIVHLLQNRDLASQIGNAARRHVIANFDWSVSAGRYNTILQRLCR